MKSSEERLRWALGTCEESGLRLTPVRSAVLELLAANRVPLNLEAISHADGVANRYDATTVYRTLMIFKDAGLVRCAGTPGKMSHFVLTVRGDDSHFLVCERCGTVVELELSPDAEVAVRRLAAKHGFAPSRQCVELLGLCQRCEEATRSPARASKLMARSCCV